MNRLLFALLCFHSVACESCALPPKPAPPIPTADAGPAPAPAPVPTPPVPVVVADAGPPVAPPFAPGVREACDNIAAVGCPEGGPRCFGSVQAAVAKRLTTVPLACLTAARSKAAVRACGSFVACR